MKKLAIFKNKISNLFVFIMAQMLIADAALAQTTGGGFSSQASTVITNVRDAIVIVVGLVATIALTWQFAQGFMGRKTWGDIMETSLWIFGAGAGVAAAVWFFNIGKTVTFA